MNKKQLRLNVHLLEFMLGLEPKERYKYLMQSPISFIKFLTDLCNNILTGNIKIDNKILIKLHPYKQLIESLCVKSISLKQRRKILQKKPFFTTIFSLVTPNLHNAV